jgi:hypothetical protein
MLGGASTGFGRKFETVSYGAFVTNAAWPDFMAQFRLDIAEFITREAVAFAERLRGQLVVGPALVETAKRSTAVWA